MTDLPHKDLFPIIHPLCEPAQEVYKQIPEIFHGELKNNYYFHLPHGYMTAEKLDKAIEQLKKLKIFETFDIKKLVKRYNISDFTQQKQMNLDDKKQCAAFWVLNASAFWFLNKFLETKDKKIGEQADYCFRMAHDYKFAWIEREGRRAGGKIRSDNIKNDKIWFFNIWNGFSELSKNNPKRAAFQIFESNKYKTNTEMYDKYKEDTLIKWCREWKKEYKKQKLK